MNPKTGAEVLFQKANIPDAFWTIEPNPRFKDIDGAKSAMQTADTQARVFKSLLTNPRQLLDIPRRWRIGIYSSPINSGTLAACELIKRAAIANVSCKCVSISDLASLNDSVAEVVLVLDCYLDSEIAHINALRQAHHRPFHLIYVMNSNFKLATEVLQILPDYAFNIVESQVFRTTGRKI